MKKQKENETFNINIKPVKTKWYLRIAQIVCIPFLNMFSKVKIKYTNIKHIKGGCLLLSNHMCFDDVFILQRVIYPRYSYSISSIDEYVGRKNIMLNLGCMPKRVYHTDLVLVRNIIRLLKHGNIVSIYPEAAFSFAGVNSVIDSGLGKLAKMAKVKVVMIKEKGNYLYSPRWNKLPKNKNIKREAEVTMLVDEKEVLTLTDKEIQERIEKAFEYDEYKYQLENNIEINSPTKANNIEKILYKCPLCNKEGYILGKGNDILLNCCNHKASLDKLNRITFDNGYKKIDTISSWFRYQEDKVKEQINNNTYYVEFDAYVTKFINTDIGFVDYATAHVIHDKEGISIKGKEIDTNNDFECFYSSKKEHSLHVQFRQLKESNSSFEVHTDSDSFYIHPKANISTLKLKTAHETFYKNNMKGDKSL